MLDKIAILQTWERQTAASLKVDKGGCEFQSMIENERDQLKHLIELRDIIRAELVEHGQLEA